MKDRDGADPGVKEAGIITNVFELCGYNVTPAATEAKVLEVETRQIVQNYRNKPNPPHLTERHAIQK